MELLLVESEVVPDLVHDGPSHFARQLLVSWKVGNERAGVENDLRRRIAVTGALAALHPIEESVELVSVFAVSTPRCATRFDHEDQLVGSRSERVGKLQQRLGDEALDAPDLSALIDPWARLIALRTVWHDSIVRRGGSGAAGAGRMGA